MSELEPQEGQAEAQEESEANRYTREGTPVPEEAPPWSPGGLY